MAKGNKIKTNVKVESVQAPEGFAKFDFAGKFGEILNILQSLPVIKKVSKRLDSQGQPIQKYQDYEAVIEFLEKLKVAAETNNFSIDENGKIIVNIVNEENMKQAEELAKALGIEVNELNNPDNILESVEILLKSFNAFNTANKNLEEEVANLTAQIKNVQAELEKEQKRINNIISVFGDDVEKIQNKAQASGKSVLEYIDDLELLFKAYCEDLGTTPKKAYEFVDDHNKKNPDKPITVNDYLKMKKTQVINKDPSKVNKILLWATIFSAVAGGIGWAGAGHHAVKQMNQPENPPIVFNIENLDPELRQYIESVTNDSDLTIEEIIQFVKDQQITIETQQGTIDDKQEIIDTQNATIVELNKYKGMFENIKDGLTEAGYSYITDENIDLEGLIDDLSEQEYSVETQNAYDTFIGYLETQGIKYEDLLDEDGNYDPDLCPENIEAYVTSTIKYLDSIQSLDGQLDDVFHKLEIVDENGKPITINTFESREEAYTFIMNYVENMKGDAFEILQNLDQDATAEDYQNILQVLEQIDKEVGELQQLAKDNQEEYDELMEEKNRLEQENEQLRQDNEQLKQNGNSQGGVEDEEQEEDNNQTVSGGEGSQDSANGDGGKNPTGGKKPGEQENEYGN